MPVGVAAALFAALVWSLNFFVPFVIGNYSIFDFALLRFSISGFVGFCFLIVKRKLIPTPSLRDWITASWLAFIGYVGYFLTVAGAAIYAGPVVAPAFLALVPIVLAIAGNLRQRSVPWQSLATPLTLVAVGLVLVNLSALDVQYLAAARSLAIGIPLAIAAVALWTYFALLNQAALARRPKMHSDVWTALILVGGGLEMSAFLPAGLALGVFEIPKLGLRWETAGSLYIWGSSLAILASVGGTWAWTLASRNVPTGLAAQLIVSETAFGTIFGLIAHGRWPTPVETGGIVLLMVGVTIAISVFHRHREPAGAS